MKSPALFAALLSATTMIACANTSPAEPGLPEIQRQALADAAKRSGLPASALTVVSAEAVIWSDGSLGCPQPGMLYTQALVPGYHIRIRAGSEVLSYHAGSRSGPAFCPASQAKAPLPRDLQR